MGDHPRIRGEKFIEFVIVRHNSRITPAYAGKSRRVRVK